MIDKSIRQHYQEGDEVKKLKLLEMGEKLTSPLKNKYISQDTGKIKKSEIAKDIGINFAKKAVARKLGLASLNPILGLLSLFGFNPFKTLTEGGAKQAFTSGVAGLGFDSPAEGRELRQLEKRKANMLRRKEEGKTYSKKNLEEVTREIAQKKGLDINNPNDMKNIDKPITQIKIEKSITEPPSIIPEEPEVKSPFAKPSPKTPDVIIPHLEGDDIIPTPTTVTRDVGLGDAGIAEKIAAENRAAEKAAAQAAAARAAAARAVDRHRGGGNGGGNGGGMGKGQDPGGGAAGSPFAKGGRVDKALGGRSRDI